LIKLITLAAGVTCTKGGVTVQVGLDNGDGGGTAGNGTLELGEVDDSTNLCNG
jgi:hypothetical protein